MRWYDYRQSNTSPLRHRLELSSDELIKVRKVIMDIIQTLLVEEEEEKNNELVQTQNWIELHSEIVEWMTEPMKFPPRSDCG